MRLLSLLAAAQPAEPVWLERRAQAQLDLKHFDAALADFEAAVRLQPPGFVSLGLLANRALAREGLADWAGAAADYRQSLALASQLGFDQPYLRNSLGNCLASQGRYAEARGEYKAAAETFRSARNLAGTIYAESNAALMDAQIGDVDAARALEAVARKAPGSIDARAALAAVRYEIGDTEGAEAAWNWACTRINSGQLVPGGSVYDGCAAYRDDDWLRTIRRWPPRLREDMSSFLALRPVGAGRR